MKAYMIHTNEPFASRDETVIDEYGNTLEPSIYLNFEDADKAAKDYNEQIKGENAWVVPIEIRESYGG